MNLTWMTRPLEMPTSWLLKSMRICLKHSEKPKPPFPNLAFKASSRSMLRCSLRSEKSETALKIRSKLTESDSSKFLLNSPRTSEFSPIKTKLPISLPSLMNWCNSKKQPWELNRELNNSDKLDTSSMLLDSRSLLKD